jgi:multidrug efflux pump subunit AcrB
MNSENNIFMKIVRTFLHGHASILLILFALCIGAASVLLTPREEEPQIVVPMADIIVNYPGASVKEVENLVSLKLEKLLWQIQGVEYVYSTSYRDMAVVTVRFFVKEDRKRSLIKLYNQLQSNIDDVVPGIQGWIVKPVEIDDVPIVSFHLYSNSLNSSELRHIAQEMSVRLAEIPNTSRIGIHGGEKRELRISLDPEKLSLNGITAMEVFQVLKNADLSLSAGKAIKNDTVFNVVTGPFFRNVEEVRNIAVSARHSRLIRLTDLATIEDGFAEIKSYSRFGKRGDNGKTSAAVAVTIAKKKGSNAVQVAEDALERMESLRKEYLPPEVGVEVTRNYGETADIKVNELLSSLFFAIVGVVTLMFFVMGWKEAVVVALAVPISFSLSLFVNYVSGYTINRVTLFALILSLGLVVDDPITNVDNIQRHILKGLKSPFEATIDAVREVLPPVLMSTLAVIVSFLPMFFITGMMGPYMEPMAINVPLTVTFSTLCAITFVPWAAYHLLKKQTENPEETKSSQNENNKPSAISVWYKNLLNSILHSRIKRYTVILLTIGLFAGSGLLVIFGLVPLKMLPFDNKNEYQVLVRMPEGSSLEKTDALVRELEQFVSGVNEVVNFQSYTGIPSPMDFNGMVRHYYLRYGSHLADLRINLLPKEKRTSQSHDIVLRLRDELTAIAAKHQALLEIVEVPPGPPVLATIVAEIYGQEDTPYSDLVADAEIVAQRLRDEPFVVDVSSTVEKPTERYEYVVDREKLAFHGVSAEVVHRTMSIAFGGPEAAALHHENERERVPIRISLPENLRPRHEILENLKVRSNNGGLVSLGEIGGFVRTMNEQPVYHKNLRPVVYVTGETAGRTPADAILSLLSHFHKNPLPNSTIDWAGEGEWKITLDVFRDLGLAFGAAMIGIYLLIVLETGSFFLPLLIMVAIPLTAIGIMPGFYILNLFMNTGAGIYETPVFFTATGMIGMIALGGIVVRNSIVLIGFIRDALAEGMDFREAILESGVVRMRPILLTAGTTLLGAWPITLDPVFSGLAWSLIFGLFASTGFTLIIVPMIYFMVFERTQKK